MIRMHDNYPGFSSSKQLHGKSRCLQRCLYNSYPKLSNMPPSGDIIITQGDNQGGGPRQLTQIPISAYYAGDVVYVTFVDDIGLVDITIEEVSNGVILQTSVNSSTLSAILPLNVSSGEFYIYFVLSTGAEYEGYFII